MKVPYRTIALSVLALGFTAVLLDNARAGGGHSFAPVSDPVVREECGSCHLAYPPSMLLARSWERMIAGLSNHFGTDASLEAKTAEHKTERERCRQRRASLRREAHPWCSPVQRPLRVTELPQWMRKHHEVPARQWTHKDVRTKANCATCHSGAERGHFEDD